MQDRNSVERRVRRITIGKLRPQVPRTLGRIGVSAPPRRCIIPNSLDLSASDQLSATDVVRRQVPLAWPRCSRFCQSRAVLTPGIGQGPSAPAVNQRYSGEKLRTAVGGSLSLPCSASQTFAKPPRYLNEYFVLSFDIAVAAETLSVSWRG